MSVHQRTYTARSQQVTHEGRPESLKRLKGTLTDSFCVTTLALLPLHLCCAAREGEDRRPHPPPHVLLAPGDAWRDDARHPGAGGSSGLDDDAALLALDPDRALADTVRLLERRDTLRRDGDNLETASIPDRKITG
jgi:hypothetical protein